jgi:uncharacterized membrane protein
VAGISWIGSSFYFIWLDSAFETPETPRHNVDGEVFMVHGGFYYQVEKKKIAPGELPKTLHWFKWEATLTFISGFALFAYLYFLNDASLLIDNNVMKLNQFEGIALSLIFIFGSWFVYDLLYNPDFIDKPKLSNIIAVPFFAAIIYGSTLVFSARGAFLLIGVIFGTSMLLNVWVRILPGQAKMLNDAENGKVPDYTLSLKSKVRSVHNTYFIFPVLFIMISNHYPMIYNHQYNWALLMVLTISGAMVRRAMVTKVDKEKFLVLPAAFGLLALVYMTAQAPKLVEVSEEVSEYSTIAPIIEKRCISCHSNNNTDETFKLPQKGILLETEAQVRSHAAKIIQQVVHGKTMPFGNKTNMTDYERAVINKFFTKKK